MLYYFPGSQNPGAGNPGGFLFLISHWESISAYDRTFPGKWSASRSKYQIRPLPFFFFHGSSARELIICGRMVSMRRDHCANVIKSFIFPGKSLVPAHHYFRKFIKEYKTPFASCENREAGQDLSSGNNLQTFFLSIALS